MEYLLAVDLETTGLDPLYNEITQVGAILLDNQLKELGSFESLVRPEHIERGFEGGKDIYKYSHLNVDDLKVAPTTDKVLRALETFVRSKIGFELNKVLIFGQNSKFDSAFLESAFKKCGWKYPFDFHIINLESIYVYHQFMKTGKLPKTVRLMDICKKAGIKNEQAHSAMADIRATVDALKVLCEGK